MNKQIVIDAYKEMLLSNKKKETIGMITNTNELQTIMLNEQSQPDPKEYILCDSIYIKFYTMKANL